jgi:hypothetical protein
MDNGKVWIDSMTKTLERLDALCAGRETGAAPRKPGRPTIAVMRPEELLATVSGMAPGSLVVVMFPSVIRSRGLGSG